MTQSTKGSVRFAGVEKSFGAVTALKSLDLSVAPGELVTLLGPSGCGKTTTLRLIAGLESPTRGLIEIGGQDVTHLSASYRKVSMVFQSYALFPHMSVRDNVGYGLSFKSLPKSELRDRAEAGLAMVGLEGFGDRLPSELSGGQQQRVAVARAIVLEPEVLLLDEPLSNLDAKLRRRVREEIREIQQRLNLTAVYVTHDQEEAMAVSDRIIVMKNAEIAQEGSPRDLYQRPNSPFIADFIGDANLLDCEVISTRDDVAQVRLGGQTVQAANPLACRGNAKLAVRPHDIRLSTPGPAPTFEGVVTYAAYLGREVQYTLDSVFGTLFVTCGPNTALHRTGEAVAVDLDPAALHVVPLD